MVEILFFPVLVLCYYFDREYEDNFSLYVTIFCISFGVMIFLQNFIPTYKEQHPERYYGGDVYQVNLASITPQITVYVDWPKERNIYKAKIEVIDTILVQHTSSNNYYREIITGKLIPVSEVAYKIAYSERVGELILGKSYYNFTSPLFIYVFSGYSSRTGTFLEYRNNSHKCANLGEIEEYIQERKNGYKGFPSFEKYIDNLYEQANCYYETAKQKNEISDEKKIQEILKKL